MNLFSKVNTGHQLVDVILSIKNFDHYFFFHNSYGQMDAPTPTPTPMVVGTFAPTPAPAPASSVAASCYPSPPIDSSIGIEESIDVDSDSEELEANTQGIRCAGRGGRPPLPKNKRKINVRKTSIAWQHFTKDPESPADKPCGAL